MRAGEKTQHTIKGFLEKGVLHKKVFLDGKE